MRFVHLVEQISERCSIPKTKVARVLKAFNEVVKTTTRSGESVSIPRFGTFFPRHLQPRAIFGGTRKISRSSTIHFHESRRA